MTFQPNREDLAWAAGFFDGEGTVGFIMARSRGRSYPRVQVMINQIDREVLDRFHQAVGGTGQVYGPYKTKTKPRWVYQASGHAGAQAVMVMLWPFLSTVKRRQAAQALRQYNEAYATRAAPT